MRGNPVFVAGREGLMRIDRGGAKLAIGVSGLAKPEQLQERHRLKGAQIY